VATEAAWLNGNKVAKQEIRKRKEKRKRRENTPDNRAIGD